MVISFYGEGCFKIQSGDLVILTDPFESSSGLTPPRFKSDITLKTLTPFPIVNSQQSTVNGQLIFGPGEYDLKGVSIIGFGLKKESSDQYIKTVYLVEVEDIRLCFLGHISEAPDPEIAEHLQEIDILFIPAGGKPFLSQETAIKLVRQIEPKIIIPSFFKVPGLKRKAGDLNPFLEEFDSAKKEPEEKLTIRKKDFAEIKKTKLIVLKI